MYENTVKQGFRNGSPSPGRGPLSAAGEAIGGLLKGLGIVAGGSIMGILFIGLLFATPLLVWVSFDSSMLGLGPAMGIGDIEVFWQVMVAWLFLAGGLLWKIIVGLIIWATNLAGWVTLLEGAHWPEASFASVLAMIIIAILLIRGSASSNE